MRKSIDFLQLTAKMPYPPSIRGKLSTVHATIINQFLETYSGKHTEKLQVVHAINCVTYMYMSSDSMPSNWNESDPFHTYRNTDDDEMEETLGDLYISTRDIDWSNVSETSKNSNSEYSESESTQSELKDITNFGASTIVKPYIIPQTTSNTIPTTPNPAIVPTDKSDLYIQPPVVPRFDVSHPWKSGIIDGTTYVIYPSYPIVPTKQNEISMTTDVNKMSDSDLRKLYPNCLIHTRAACMYESYGDLLLDPKLGIILPIEGYTKAQLVDNIVKYPHIFRLLKQVDGNLDSFYSTLEIDGKLYKISEVWNTLPESNLIPYTKEYVKEYVVRRYLLERDIKRVDHKYKLYGSLDPFLTLFTSPTDYINMGYDDILQMAKSCVIARVEYKKSRNPVLGRLQNA